VTYDGTLMSVENPEADQVVLIIAEALQKLEKKKEIKQDSLEVRRFVKTCKISHFQTSALMWYK